ncbi:hypothetical protein RRG08_046236 [Elysia crispata]|uniref:Uncharacterized protein n=1 Tax=Elysia crispata TaxID=231223 RepID=A0AAE0YWG7_9GAST|nr:hypothetical protein RRG08_046236 [Elysia crispata]
MLQENLIKEFITRDIYENRSCVPGSEDNKLSGQRTTDQLKFPPPEDLSEFIKRLNAVEFVKQNARKDKIRSMLRSSAVHVTCFHLARQLFDESS